MADKEEKSPEEALLDVVKEAFDRCGKWPTRQYVEAVLDQDHQLDLDGVLKSAPRSRVYAAGTQEGSEVILTVAGLASAGADRDVRRFVEALGWCVSEQMGFRPDPGKTAEVKLDADQFKSEWTSRGEEVSETDLKKLREMLITEHVYSSIGGEDGKWTITLNRGALLPYREVITIADYLKLKEPEAEETPPEKTAGQVEVVPNEPLSPDRPTAAWIEEMPPRMRQACGVLFTQGHFAHGVLEAVKVMSEILREASGLELDGEKLASAAFNLKSPHVVVADLTSETGKNRQRGVMLIARGIFAGVRNPIAHDQIVVPAEEAHRVIAMIVFVTEAIEGGSRASAADLPA